MDVYGLTNDGLVLLGVGDRVHVLEQELLSAIAGISGDKKLQARHTECWKSSEVEAQLAVKLGGAFFKHHGFDVSYACQREEITVEEAKKINPVFVKSAQEGTNMSVEEAGKFILNLTGVQTAPVPSAPLHFKVPVAEKLKARSSGRKITAPQQFEQPDSEKQIHKKKKYLFKFNSKAEQKEKKKLSVLKSKKDREAEGLSHLEVLRKKHGPTWGI